MINNFLLDADETILDFVRSSRESLRFALEMSGIEYHEEYFAAYKAINDAIWKDYERGEITKAMLSVVRFSRFFDRIGICADAAKTNEIYFKKLSKTGYMLPGADQFLRQMKLRGKIYLITNGTPAAQYGRLDSLGIRDVFEGIYVSDEIGYAKPDRRFFEYVLQKEALRKNECIVIGDSLSSDIAGAGNAGLKCIWYNPTDKPLFGASPDYIASDYARILAIIDSLKD